MKSLQQKAATQAIISISYGRRQELFTLWGSQIFCIFRQPQCDNCHSEFQTAVPIATKSKSLNSRKKKKEEICFGWWSHLSNQYLIQYLKPLSFARCGHIGTLSNEKAFGNHFLAQVVCVKREGFIFMNLWCVSFFRHNSLQDIVWTLNSCWSKSEIVAWSGSQEHTNVGFKDI